MKRCYSKFFHYDHRFVLRKVEIQFVILFGLGFLWYLVDGVMVMQVRIGCNQAGRIRANIFQSDTAIKWLPR